jgi:hypothetical protein
MSLRYALLLFIGLLVAQINAQCQNLLTSKTVTPAITKPAACTKLPYNLFLPLSNYPPAESYCSSKFSPPAPFVSTYVTLSCVGNKRAFIPNKIRNPAPAPALITGVAKLRMEKRVAQPATKTTCDAKCSLLSSLATQAASAVSTICACIETQAISSTTTV